ncbi:DUF3939 domain-containing protein [Evansella cellulosilytica]|uniref:DUF3939 domain-containing protein n=1 Tax=Evansella cellulosilytica (strain ATCC 21833 / DSM 2522 / FERM P-1141 / JCM 9156 / N-4) TaxID=649639 RepID=E6U210_EVAC2|nr:DUF3939 domain-containing protein [Evansella cellulosilytica]ADU29254.1 hypothetical protein Bcell_0981 [Evansella cellulosilytica DSM 2522]
MFFKKRKKNGDTQEEKREEKIVTVTIDEVRAAVNKYANNMQKGISLRSIVLDNNEIDFEALYSYLGGKPDRPFYMSKETFEIFEEKDYPKYIDLCQIACDQYILENGEEPITTGDPERKVNFQKLKHYLTEKPPFKLYLHPQDRMVTHRAPK